MIFIHISILLTIVKSKENYVAIRTVDNNESVKQDLIGSSIVHLVSGSCNLIYTIFENHDEPVSFCTRYLSKPSHFTFMSSDAKRKIEPPKNLCHNEPREKPREKKPGRELYNATFLFEKSSAMKEIDISNIYRYGFLAFYLLESNGSTNVLFFDDIPEIFDFNFLEPGTKIYLQYFDTSGQKISFPREIFLIFRYQLARM